MAKVSLTVVKKKAPAAKSPAQAEAEAKKSQVEFPVPEGLNVDGIEKGEEHDMLATFYFDGEGKMCIKAIEGIPVTKADEEEQAEERKEDAPEDDMSGGETTSQGDMDVQPNDEIAPPIGGQGGFVDSMG